MNDDLKGYQLVSVQATGGVCDHCGTPLTYSAILQHPAQEDTVRIGETCLAQLGRADSQTRLLFVRLKREARIAKRRALAR